jgi:phosphoribosyl 1,2-cyclic phosphodiesterase
MASLSPFQDLFDPTKNVACKIGMEMEFECPRRPLELRRSDRRREWSADASDMEVQFWGVRGSIACPDPELARYGGNTSCVEVRCGDSLLILDAGTGLRGLGRSLVAGGEAVRANILLSHCHIDHIIGLPFFAPCHIPTTSLRLWAGHLSPLATALRQMMSEPLFPIGFESFKAAVELHDFCVGDVLTPAPGVTVRTAALNHPGGATGYRIEYGASSLAYITDTEHRPGELDRNVLSLAAGVDLMIYDSTYTDEAWPAHVGWGHSSWQQGVRLAGRAKVKTLALFHHNPEHNDAVLDRLAEQAHAQFPGTIVAAEGMRLRLGNQAKCYEVLQHEVAVRL